MRFTVFKLPAETPANFEVVGTGAAYIPAGKSPNLGVSNHLEVIGTGTTYIPAGSSSNLGVIHHLEMNVSRDYLYMQGGS